ncbi:MAG: hypothetical protein IT377_23705 [Polyangiaceae bacterium]|nr:hypothetical protein [Polyangiaceae bacterium]
MTSIRALVVGFCSLCLASCSGDPFRAIAEAEPDEPRLGLPVNPVAGPALATLPRHTERAFARKGPSLIAELDAQTGRVISTTVAGAVLRDLARDGDRLVAAISGDDLESTTVRALEVQEGKIAPAGESDPLGPGGRLFALPPFTLALTEDMAVTWSLLDADLRLVPGSQAVARPASLVASTLPLQLLALSPTGYDSGDYSDTLVVARFDETWQLDFHSIPAPGRPSSRLAGAPDRDEAYLVRKHTDSYDLELAEISRVTPAVPATFRTVSVPGALGEVEDVVVAADRDLLLVLLSRGASTGALAIVPLNDGATPGLVPLSAPVESSPWFQRALALLPSGRVLAATTLRLEAFDLVAGPALLRRDDFEGEGLVAPVVGWE